MGRPRSIPREPEPGSDEERVLQNVEQMSDLFRVPSHLVAPPAKDAKGQSVCLQIHIPPAAMAALSDLLGAQWCPWRTAAEFGRAAVAMLLHRVAGERGSEFAPTTLGIFRVMSENNVRQRTILEGTEVVTDTIKIVQQHQALRDFASAKATLVTQFRLLCAIGERSQRTSYLRLLREGARAVMDGLPWDLGTWMDNGIALSETVEGPMDYPAPHAE